MTVYAAWLPRLGSVTIYQFRYCMVGWLPEPLVPCATILHGRHVIAVGRVMVIW